MWTPDRVVPHYKRRAIALWLFLVISIVNYGIWLVYQGIKKRKHPTRTFITSDDLYPYPDVSVCLFNDYGCDSIEQRKNCVMSVNDTEGGPTRARYYPWQAEDQQDISTKVGETSKGWCVAFEASAVDIAVGSERNSSDPWDYLLFDIYWYPGGSLTSNTCGVGEDHWESHSAAAHIYLNNSETGILSTGIQVPYTCMTNASSGHMYNAVGIGVTEVTKLDGSVLTSYKALSKSSIMYNDERTEKITGIQKPYAHLHFEIAQDPDSLEIITENDPLDIATILGNIGGFWDLLRIFWPIFFVVTSRQDPFLKPRNLKKTVLKATKAVTNVIAPTTGTSRGPSRTTSTVEEVLPAWESSGVSADNEQVGGVFIRSFDDHELVAVINGGPVKKFLKSEFNAKSLKGGATEAPLLKLLPPNTYLIMVQPGSTTTSVVKSVIARCRVGGDAVDNFDATSIAVEAKRANLSVLQSQALSASTYVQGIDAIREESNFDTEEICGSVALPGLLGRPKRPRRFSLDDQSIGGQTLLSANGRHPIPSNLPRPLAKTNL